MWALMYALAPRARRLMLITSLALAHYGVILEYWYVRDYWHPHYIGSMSVGDLTFSLEDYLFGFAVSGLSAGLFALTLPMFDDDARAGWFRSGAWWRLQAAGVAFEFF